MAIASKDKQYKSFFRSKEIITAVILVIVFSTLYVLTLNGYLQEGRTAAQPYQFGDEKNTNSILANYKVLALDPVKGEVSLRVDLIPQGDLTTDGGYSSTQSLSVMVNSATGQLERTFDKGKIISPFDMVVQMDGLVNDYPFDSYQSAVILNITGKTDPAAQAEDVPVFLQLTANIPGFDIAANEDKESSNTTQIINLDVKRSNTVVSVAIGGMIIMWAIGVAVIFLTMAYLFRSRKAEAFAFYSGLLFGIFGLRNSLPGTPPIGTQSDFLSFIWVEAIVAIMMVVVITVSLLRPQK